MSVALEIDGPVAHIVLDRPEKLNALDQAMVAALFERCREVERSAARVVILSGRGKAFCAGGDIDAWSEEPPAAFGRHWVRGGHDTFDALARLSLPLIAVIDGHALGGGLELAACADLRIAEKHVKIGLPETGLGVIPGWSGTQRAVRRFGAPAVRRMALFGEIFSAEEALALGIVDEVVETGEAMAAAKAAAERVLTRSPIATELTKMAIAVAEGEETERVVEAFAGTLAAASPELAEGLAAFRQKRKPDFR